MIAELVIPSGGAYFEGHFPGRPILPGILELKLIVDLLKRELEITAPLQKSSSRGFVNSCCREIA